MLLSHEHSSIEITPAPNPRDIIWENVSIPHRQIIIRNKIAAVTLSIGAIFWSIVVTFISAVFNLQSLSIEVPVIEKYSNTKAYDFLNNTLSIGLLLVLLNSLPVIFDFISRKYEGIKLESEIQNSIMNRLFYYQLANVFVAVGLGSIATSLNEIFINPSSIMSLLGSNVPSFSIYFMNLVIMKTFTSIPLEILRPYQLAKYLNVKIFYDETKFTHKELHSGVFADAPILYGWIYPNLLMVLMIMVTYSSVSLFSHT
jgi:hypothetical protein